MSQTKSNNKECRLNDKSLTGMLDNITEGCQIIDYHWRYKYVNKAAAEHGQKSKEELIGANVLDLYPGIEKTELFNSLRDCMKTRKYYYFVNEFTYQDGTKRWFSLTIQPDPQGIFITSVDITDLKLSELKREKLIVELKGALDEVNSLKGLIPICANCKKIRNDQGYWQQIEKYIQEHSGAQFSHDICPKCTEKLYPNIHINPRKNDHSL